MPWQARRDDKSKASVGDWRGWRSSIYIQDGEQSRLDSGEEGWCADGAAHRGHHLNHGQWGRQWTCASYSGQVRGTRKVPSTGQNEAKPILQVLGPASGQGEKAWRL